MSERPNTETKVSAQAAELATKFRFNPIRGLTPAKFVQIVEQFMHGHLREFAVLSEEIIQRDDVLESVVPKRFGAVAELEWEILTKDDSPQAKLHKEALLHCYNHLLAQNAFDLDEEGSVRLLINQMMSATAVKYAVQELVWQPRGKDLTVTTRHVPLQFFERTTGKLKFLRNPWGQYGEDMEPGAWLVTVGRPLMIASGVAYLFKRLPMKDWLDFTETYGKPLMKGVTTAQPKSSDWNEFVQALSDAVATRAVVVSAGNTVDVDNGANFGGNPFESLIDRMDRALARLWRGGDLSTVSNGNGAGTGASLQGDEGGMLLASDARMISETLQQRLDRWVIRYAFGRNVEPLAYFKLKVPQPSDTQLEIMIDQHLAGLGVKLNKQAALERYGRTEAASDEAALIPRATPAPAALPLANPALPNEADKLKAAAAVELARAQQADLRPLAEALQAIHAETDPVKQAQALRALLEKRPDLLKQINTNSQTAAAIAKILGTSMADGLSQPPKTV